jgi:hypothetical protein
MGKIGGHTCLALTSQDPVLSSPLDKRGALGLDKLWGLLVAAEMSLQLPCSLRNMPGVRGQSWTSPCLWGPMGYSGPC